jgi:hypothetical protein
LCEHDRVTSQPPGASENLPARLARLGGSLGEREAQHRADLDRARAEAERIHAQVADALAAFHRAVADAGVDHLRVALGDVHLDDKHLRAFEFDLTRGRHRAIVTAKSRGEVTLVGPFRSGKTEGPCRSFPFEAGAERDAALGDFLERFLEEAATP